jgi:hypothetical protein
MFPIILLICIVISTALYRLTVPVAGLVYYFWGPTYGNVVVVMGFTLVLAAVSVAVYSVRSRFRVLYGMIEVVASLVFIAVSVSQYFQGTDLQGMPINEYLPLPIATLSLVQIVGAIYVFVRGMDNIGEGLREYPGADMSRRFFFPHRQDVEKPLILRTVEAIRWVRRRL